MSCIFCKIMRGEVPSMKVYEDEYTIALMDIAGDVDGHLLVIPKKHVEGVLDCDELTLSRVMETVKRVSCHLVEVCGYEGVNCLNASGESAGQSVPHFHIHVIPRKHGDGLDAWPKFDGAKHPIEDTFARLNMQ
ncbi:MAG: HIT family protein [Clostridia bacterium]|nr:HIT family protein [Clostridia bacterium]